MSNMPLVPPVLPLVDDEANKPEPGSEEAARRKAERVERLENDEVTDGDELAGEPLADSVKQEVEAAERRQKGMPDPNAE